MRSGYAVLVLFISFAPASAQQAAPPTRALDGVRVASTYSGTGPSRMAARGLAVLPPPMNVGAHDPDVRLAAGTNELIAGRKLSVTGGVIGAVVGAAAGVALACLANRDSYGVYCAGQDDAKLVIGGVIGAGVGGFIGAWLLGER